jgi:hypothetical protein
MSGDVVQAEGKAPWRGAALFAALAAVVVLGTWSRTVPISNDGVQYVEGARRLLAGDGYSTGILYFDEHYQTGRLPAPQTVWPPGTSLGIAGLAALGMEPESAGRLLARLSFILLPPLVFLIGLRLTGRMSLAALCAAWQLGMTEFWMYLASPNSELPFLAAILGAVALVPDGSDGEWRWLPAGLLAGVAAVFRYAGAFFLVALGLVLLVELVREWRSRRAFRVRPLLLAAPGFLILIALMLRNRALAGDLRGGNTRTVIQPVADLLVETVRSLADVMFGVVRSELVGGGAAAFAAGAGLVALLIIVAAAGMGAWPLRFRFHPGNAGHRYAAILGLCVTVYVAAIILTASRTMLTYGSRYLLPVVPLVACLTVFLTARTARA